MLLVHGLQSQRCGRTGCAVVSTRGLDPGPVEDPCSDPGSQVIASCNA